MAWLARSRGAMVRERHGRMLAADDWSLALAVQARRDIAEWAQLTPDEIARLDAIKPIAIGA